MRAFLFEGAPFPAGKVNQDVGDGRAGQGERMGFAEGDIADVANPLLALDVVWWKQVVLDRHPTTSNGQATRYQAKEFRELAPRDVLTLHALDGKIYFVGVLARQRRVIR